MSLNQMNLALSKSKSVVQFPLYRKSKKGAYIYSAVYVNGRNEIELQCERLNRWGEKLERFHNVPIEALGGYSSLFKAVNRFVNRWHGWNVNGTASAMTLSNASCHLINGDTKYVKKTIMWGVLGSDSETTFEQWLEEVTTTVEIPILLEDDIENVRQLCSESQHELWAIESLVRRVGNKAINENYLHQLKYTISCYEGLIAEYNEIRVDAVRQQVEKAIVERYELLHQVFLNDMEINYTPYVLPYEPFYIDYDA